MRWPQVGEDAPKLPKDHLIVVNLCGRGDKDIFAVAKHLGDEAVSAANGSMTNGTANRLDLRFAELKQAGPRRAGHLRHRRRSRSRDLAGSARALPAAGADVIELGMPFTDPMADGPAIQASSLRALRPGTTMTKTLALVREFRRDDGDTPIVLMGYYNPIYVYGVDAFLARCEGRRRRRPHHRRPAARGG